MKYFVSVIAVLVVGVFQGLDSVLPPSIPICQRNDPQISDCIVNAVRTLQPRLASGDLGAGFKVPPMEPIIIKELNPGQGNGIQILLRDLKVNGASKFVIDKLRANVNDLRFDIIVTIPKLDVNAKYKMSTVFLGNALQSEGDYMSQNTNSRIKIQMKGNKYQKNGLEYIRFDPFAIKFGRGDVAFLKITNLFGGNKILSDIVHNLILNNQDFLLKNLHPQIEAVLSRLFTEAANKVVENAPLSELFP